MTESDFDAVTASSDADAEAAFVRKHPDEAAKAIARSGDLDPRMTRWPVVQKYWDGLSWPWRMWVLARRQGARIVKNGVDILPENKPGDTDG